VARHEAVILACNKCGAEPAERRRLGWLGDRRLDLCAPCMEQLDQLLASPACRSKEFPTYAVGRQADRHPRGAEQSRDATR